MLAASCSFTTMNAPVVPMQQQSAAEVAEKVMRRVEIAKVARNLQDCLAFASFKAQHGWQDRTLRSIEPEIAEKMMRRKRPYTDQDLLLGLHRSGREGPDLSTSTVSVGPRKRMRALSTSGLGLQAHNSSWKQDHLLAQSSPVEHALPYDGHSALSDSPMFDAPASDDEDQDTLLPSVHEPSSSIISSSPPRTPPPIRRVQAASKSFGADHHLVCFANSSRSPAVHVARIPSATKEHPFTPPSQHARLPSSMMHTPGGNMDLFNGALHTPGQNFNFADFCNVTPSPGQAHWGSRTPAISKTPARLARSSLNFDSLVPPSSTPRQPTGLALQLGDELMP